MDRCDQSFAPQYMAAAFEVVGLQLDPPHSVLAVLPRSRPFASVCVYWLVDLHVAHALLLYAAHPLAAERY